MLYVILIESRAAGQARGVLFILVSSIPRKGGRRSDGRPFWLGRAAAKQRGDRATASRSAGAAAQHKGCRRSNGAATERKRQAPDAGRAEAAAIRERDSLKASVLTKKGRGYPFPFRKIIIFPGDSAASRRGSAEIKDGSGGNRLKVLSDEKVVPRGGERNLFAGMNKKFFPISLRKGA